MQLSESIGALVSDWSASTGRVRIGLYRSYRRGRSIRQARDTALPVPGSAFCVLLMLPTHIRWCWRGFNSGRGEVEGGAVSSSCSNLQRRLVKPRRSPDSGRPRRRRPETLREEPVESPKSYPPCCRTRRTPCADSGRRGAARARSSRRWTLWLCALAQSPERRVGWTLEHQPRWAPLALHAGFRRTPLDLGWAASAVQQASQGMMTVTDGAAQNQIP
jgi:hypothetical protein